MSEPRSSGFSLIEVVVVLAIVGVVTAMAVPASERFFENARLGTTARSVNALFSFARGEAVRTGNIHIAFFENDADSNSLVGPNGGAVDMLVIDDGRPGSTNQNCAVDAGEARLGFSLETGVDFGVNIASAKGPHDTGGGSIGSGTTFEDDGGNPAKWVLFRPEGTTIAFSSSGGCSAGPIGSGGGGVYLENGSRDVAIVLMPLGSSRIYAWNASTDTWRD